MRRSTSSKTGGSPSKNASDLLSTMSSATQNNARVRSDLQSMQSKVDSARRHLNTHNRQFHATGEESSSGESNENRSPHHQHRSRSSTRDTKTLNVRTDTAGRSKSRDKATRSVLYPAELQYLRRSSREGGRRTSAAHDSTLRSSPAKSISPTRHESSFLDQTLLPELTASPRRRSTYVVSGQPRDSNFSLRGDSTFTVGRIDRHDSTTVSHDETVIAPGLLEDEYRPTSRKKQKTMTTSHGSTSVFHSRCTPNASHLPEEVSNAAWEVQFLPGSLKNARMVESNRRSAAVDTLSPNAEAVRYQEERTRKQEEELKRLAREQMNGRSTREIFDNWVPLHEERRKMEREGEGRGEDEDKSKKSTRRLWESAEQTSGGGGILENLERMERREERGEGEGENRRVVEEDDAGYAMPLPRDVLHRPRHYRTPDTTVPLPALRTPSPSVVRGVSPDEQYFTPSTTVKRLSRVEGGGEWRELGETPILGRQSTRLSTTFMMERSERRLRAGADKEADRSTGSSLWPTPDRRDLWIDGGNRSIQGGVNRSIGEYATPIGRRGVERRREGDEQEQNSFLNASHNQSRIGLNESMNAFERSLNRSLDTLSDLATRLSSQLEASKANLSSMEPIGEEGRSAMKEKMGRMDGVRGDRQLGMEASILGSLPPMREERQTVGGAEELKRILSSAEKDHRSSLPERTRREGEEEITVEQITSPIPTPRPRTTVPSSFGLSNLLDANIGWMERNEQYEREAERLEGVVHQVNESAAVVEKEKREKSTPIPIARSHPLTAPQPLPRSQSPSMIYSAEHAAPFPQLAIDTAGGRSELMEMYESRHRNWHRRGDDLSVPSPRGSISRSPSPLTLPNPAELRERQSKQGMIDQRAKAVGGAFLHLLRRLYKTRFERRYEEKRQYAGDAAREAAFAEEQKREVTAFKKEAEEAKRRAIDETIRYRDFMLWLKEESERMEGEIEFEVERRERRRWERKNGEERRRNGEQSILDSSRFLERERILDERARKAMRTTMAAKKYAEKRENVRRLENDARRAIAFAEIPSSARSSIDDTSFLLNQSLRRYSLGHEPLRVTSARGAMAETSLNASRDVSRTSRDVSRAGSEDNEEEKKKKIEEEKMMKDLREKLEERRRQAEGVRRAMETSQKELKESEVVSVAAQLTAHDEYIQGVEAVGRVIGQSVQPRSSRGLPPGVEPLDLSSLDEEEERGEKREEKSGTSSIMKSQLIEGIHSGQESLLSQDSLDARSSPVSSIPSKKSTTSSTTSSSSSSSNKTLNAVEEISRRLEEVTVSGEEKKSTVEEKEAIGEEQQFSPLRDLDRSLPSTVVSTGRQEITMDIVPEPVMTTVEQDPTPEETVKEEITVAPKPLFSPLESSTSLSEESSERNAENTVAGGVKDMVEEKKVSIENTVVKGLSSSEEGEKETLDVSTTSLKKAISVASEMADPFDGFESSSGSGKSVEEEKKPEFAAAPVVQQLQPSSIVAAAAAARLSTSTTLTTTSTDQTTVVERKDEEEEISWGGSEGGLEVGGGTSERSADFDWGSSLDEKSMRREEKKEEEKEEEVKKETEREQSPPLPLSSHRSEKRTASGEGEETKKRGKFESIRDRLNKINSDDVEDEKKSEKSISSSIASSSVSSSTSSSAQSSSDSTSMTSSSRSKSSAETERSSDSEKKEEEEGDEGEGEKTPRVVSSAASGGVSSASGSIDFDEDVPLPVDSSRTPRAPSTTRFRLSLDDSFPDSPRDAAHKSTSIHNGRVMGGGGGGSPRATPTPPHTPRAHLIHSTSISSPNAHALTSPDARKGRFSAVMPSSPRSGRRSTSPKNFSLSREASFLVDDSSLGDISRLSAVELPSNTTGGQSNAILSSLPPISPSFPPISSSSPSLPRPSLSLNQSQSIGEDDGEMDESVSFLMDVKPASSVLSSLPIAELIGDTNDEEMEMEIVSPPLTLTARTSNGAAHEQCVALGKREFIQPRIEREVEQIWKIVEKKGYYSTEDTAEFNDLDLEEEDGEEITVLRNERIRLIRGASVEIAASLFPRDLRKLEDGRSAPPEIVPLRRMKLAPTKERLRVAIEKELMPETTKKDSTPHIRRMRGLGIQFDSIPPEDRILYTELYAREENLYNSDAERLEILNIIMNL